MRAPVNSAAVEGSGAVATLLVKPSADVSVDDGSRFPDISYAKTWVSESVLLASTEPCGRPAHYRKSSTIETIIRE